MEKHQVMQLGKPYKYVHVSHNTKLLWGGTAKTISADLYALVLHFYSLFTNVLGML